MEKPLNESFLFQFFDYMTSHGKQTIAEEAREDCDKFIAWLIKVRHALADELSDMPDDWVEFVGRSDVLNAEKVDELTRIKTELFGLGIVDVMHIYSAMFAVERCSDISSTASEIVREHFADVVLDIARKTNTPLFIRSERDLERFKKSAFKILSEYSIKYFPEERMKVWGYNYTVGPRPIPNPEPFFDNDFKSYTPMECFVHPCGEETLARLENVRFLAGFGTTDADSRIMRIGNLITFISMNSGDAVSYQIVGYEPFCSYEEMFNSLGTVDFGFKNKTPTECSNIMRSLTKDFKQYCAAALRVRKLAIPVLKSYDFIKLCAIPGDRYYNDDPHGVPLDFVDGETCIRTECCGINVPNYCVYCPKCGERIDLGRSVRCVTEPGFTKRYLGDHTQWQCDCRKGIERFDHQYCPACGQRREIVPFNPEFIV